MAVDYNDAMKTPTTTDTITDTLTIMRPDDWHVHLRDGAMLAAVVGDSAMRFARIVVMPNLSPPVTTVAMAMAYRDEVMAAVADKNNAEFCPLMSLYLTDNTARAEVAVAAANPHIAGYKLYPAGVTTNADAGVTRVANIMPVLEAMAEHRCRVAGAW